MDIQAIVAPTINDFHALDEFVESLHDATPGIERDVARLKATPGDEEIVDDLFRAFHSIKGEAAVHEIELATLIIDPMETLVARLRDRELMFSRILAETILLSIDRLELAVENLSMHQSLDNLRLPGLVQGLRNLASASAGDIAQIAEDLVRTVTDFGPPAEEEKTDTVAEPTHSLAWDSDDLMFFRSLADQFENRSFLFKGRTLRLLHLASEANQVMGRIVDPVQLEAAVYMHDIGMMFLPESAWLKLGPITAEERALLRGHPAYAAGILSRIKGWEAAAEMVAQHHEMPDGKGYPEGLLSQSICAGAKILSIVDAFESVMLKHASSGKNRSLLRAVAEINACDNQFATEWIKPFNQVIQRSIHS
jgi:HD-GYP domain-containing protein (c-di-GMP phosphodiesterase class II)